MKFNQLPKHVRDQLAKAGHPVAKTTKYNAVKVTIDGITFDSKAEGARYSLNKLRIQQRQLSYQLLQVPFRLPGGIKYIVDFVEFHPDGSYLYIDVKGKVTQMFKTKKKQVEALYPVKIVCVKCTNVDRMAFEPVVV
ncbi:MAG: DUF1064 domain-containing protein [Pseudomonadales bacterium]